MPYHAVCLALLSLLLILEPKTAGQDSPKANGGRTIEQILEPIRNKHRLPALAAAVVNSKGLVAIGAVGVRKRGCRVPVTIHDQFHIGSDTKAMTAVLVGRLVEKKLLRWNTRLAQLFPELLDQVPPAFAEVTLKQLLTHHSGLPANLIWWAVPGKDVRQKRINAMKEGFKSKALGKPGEKFLYSNIGYTAVGAMIERAAGRTWEELIADEVFTPLGMKSAGFGAAGDAEKIDQPWPHHENGKPVKPGPFADNAAVLGPGGRVHVSLPDWARFIADELRGTRGEPALLKPATYKMLFTSPFPDHFYTLGGWAGSPKSKRAGGLVLSHDGSNRMNYAHAWLAPERDFAVLVVTNQGGEPGQDGCHDAGKAIIERFLKH